MDGQLEGGRDEAGVNVVDSVICYDAPDDEGEAACRALGAELA